MFVEISTHSICYIVGVFMYSPESSSILSINIYNYIYIYYAESSIAKNKKL